MILTGNQILKEIKKGNISISPFSDSRLNPNSYNLCLHNELKIYRTERNKPIDMKKELEMHTISIPESGLILKPGLLYLGRSVEYTETHKYLPCLEGRSSIGRLGINIHITAGFGDVGFKGYWTLEISCVEPVIIYPNIEICQIYYQEVKGKITEYHGKYHDSDDILGSRMYKELN